MNQVISKRFCKKQQMAWTPRGAHLLLQIRTRVLNGDWEATFQQWYPGFRAAPQQMAAYPTICPVLRGGGGGNVVSLLDAMRLTVLQQTAKGLPDKTRDDEADYPLCDPGVRDLERLKCFLWHGNVYKALQVVQLVEIDLDAAVANTGDGTARKLLKAVEEFHTYIANNKGFIPNYGERYRMGERISTGFVESTVNQMISKRFCKRQQMPWTKRAAHLLLQMRVKTLNHELAAVFRRWYPNFPVQQDEAWAA